LVLAGNLPHAGSGRGTIWGDDSVQRGLVRLLRLNGTTPSSPEATGSSCRRLTDGVLIGVVHALALVFYLRHLPGNSTATRIYWRKSCMNFPIVILLLMKYELIKLAFLKKKSISLLFAYVCSLSF
jgi:hypothetical protein